MAEYWSSPDSKGYKIKMVITTSSQNKTANTSSVRFELWLYNTNYTFASYNVTGSITYDGGKKLNYSGQPSMLSFNSSLKLLDQTVTINHNTDGSKSFTASATLSGSGGYSPNTLNIGSINYTLAKIARASTVSVPQGTIGSPVTISITRQDSSYTHTLRYAWASKSGTISTGVATSFAWNIPLDFANDIPSTDKGNCIIYVDTYSGSTLIATSQTTFTAVVPNSMVPTLGGISLLDTNTKVKNLLNKPDTFLQLWSSIQVNFTGMTGSYSSTISSYYAEITGKNQSTNQNGGSFGVINYNGTVTITAYVTDSRGRKSNTISKTINIIEYKPPYITFSVTRAGTLENVLVVTRTVSICPITVDGINKNTMTLTFKVAPTSTGVYTVDNGSAGGTFNQTFSMTNSAANLGGSYSQTTSYTVIGQIDDLFTTNSYQTNATTMKVVYAYDQYGLGVMKIRERGALDVNGDGYFSGNVYVNLNPIQSHALTMPTGQAFQASTDWNNYKTTGFFRATGLLNAPPTAYDYNNAATMSWVFVRVTHHDNGWVLQEAIDFNGIASWFRTYKSNTAWTSWKQYAVQGENVSFNRVNILDVKQTTFTGPYQIPWKLIRVGNMVTINVERHISVLNDNAENKPNTETLPLGYRPISSACLRLNVNVNSNTDYGPTLFHINNSGALSVTNYVTTSVVRTGTVTYITNDPYP